MDTTYLRQQDLITPEDLDGLDLDVVGVGMLGGAILLCLVKMGFGITNRITVTDFDRCEAHNLPTQWFREADAALDRPKVEAVEDLVAWLADRPVTAVAERFTGAEERRVGPIVVLAVDSLREREAIWERLRERSDVRLVVDARAGAEVVEVWTVVPGSAAVDDYEESLRGEGFEEPCTRRAVAYAPLGAAAVVGSVLRRWVAGQGVVPRVTVDLRNFRIECADGP